MLKGGQYVKYKHLQTVCNFNTECCVKKSMKGQATSGIIFIHEFLDFLVPKQQILDSLKLMQMTISDLMKVLQTGRKQCGKRRNC